MSIKDTLLKTGVVGAGGAGFPAYIKASSNAEFVLANGAECEPLIHKDVELMKTYPEEIVNGFKILKESTGAKKGFFGIKEKNRKAIDSIESFLDDSIKLTKLGDFYPSGDEYELVYEATGKLIPPKGIPLDVGCVVNNVETLYNISRAKDNVPVTEKFLCVTGDVNKPSAFFAPIGISFKELIEHAGGTRLKDFGLFVGGVMMGRLTFDLNEVVTKTTAGLIVLPKDHYLIKRKNQPKENWYRIGKSACDQCSYCTELCPRYLLGYQVEPHKVMRSLGFSKTGSKLWNQMAELCCACGLCTLYSCPEDLYPKEACDKAKTEMRIEGINFVQNKPVKVHPIKEGRRVPLKQLIKKLSLDDYNVDTPINFTKPKTGKVKILLKQHIGEKCLPSVNKSERIEKLSVVAKPPEGKLGTFIHSPISGVVKEITDDFIIIAE